jgi:hypothetical protein
MKPFMLNPNVLSPQTASQGFQAQRPASQPVAPQQPPQNDLRRFASILGQAMVDPNKSYHEIAQKQRQGNATIEFLRSAGANDAELQWAQQSPSIMDALMKEAFARRASRYGQVKKPSTIQEYEFARQQGYEGSYMDFRQGTKGGVTVNNLPAGVPPSDADFRKNLNNQSGKEWAEILKQGNVAASTMGDLEVLEELTKVAPQGPIEGRLAALVPGYDSAAAAMESIVKRVAPTMRAEGSGSTSDIEYAGMLASLPQLQNRPEGNRAIIQIMRAKQQLDLERAQVVSQYQTNQITQQQAIAAMTELNRRSIMTPELRQALAGLTPQAPTGQAAPEVSPSAPVPGTVMDGFRFKGGDPADRSNWEPML